MRTKYWIYFTALMLALVGFLAPQQIPLTIYKLSIWGLAVPLSYWVDRWLMKHAVSMKDLSNRHEMVASTRMLCRVLVYFGTALCLALMV